MTRFRPCIDLHHGKVKQIVGGSLRDDGEGLKTNFESAHPADYYASLYRRDGLTGGHVIQLGPGNEQAARAALAAFPGGLQIGGGIRPENVESWLDAGASHVIVTSWLFDGEGRFQPKRLDAMVGEAGRECLVIDLSCRGRDGEWVVAMNRWQTPTDLRIDAGTLAELESQCDEFLVHAADVEGRCAGIDEDLVRFLAEHTDIPVTYAGGVAGFDDLKRVESLSDGAVDLTIGSALDLFGGDKIRYADCVAWNRERSNAIG